MGNTFKEPVAREHRGAVSDFFHRHFVVKRAVGGLDFAKISGMIDSCPSDAMNVVRLIPSVSNKVGIHARTILREMIRGQKGDSLDATLNAINTGIYGKKTGPCCAGLMGEAFAIGANDELVTKFITVALATGTEEVKAELVDGICGRALKESALPPDVVAALKDVKGSRRTMNMIETILEHIGKA